MLSNSKAILRVIPKGTGFCKYYSQVGVPKSDSEKPKSAAELNAEDAEKRKAAAALAMQSLKDMGSLLSSSAPDDETQPIDTRPIYADNTLFGSLSLLHQGQVCKELQDKYDKKWHKLTPQDKKLGYYIAYGNWGSRENFDNWKSTTEPPYDLPFHTPSKVSNLSPSEDTKIKLIQPPVNLAETPIRKPQFNIKRIDGATKFFIYLIVLIAMVAVYRDKEIGEAGKPTEQIIIDPYEEKRLENERKRLAEEEEELKRKLAKKWYYLWLK